MSSPSPVVLMLFSLSVLTFAALIAFLVGELVSSVWGNRAAVWATQTVLWLAVGFIGAVYWRALA